MEKERLKEAQVSKAEAAGDEQARLVEGLDFYEEDGFIVFTAHFLLRRGFCCRNGCRHCPYQQTIDE
ncbi:MAG TPA: DUF5522 domain-containing protein [Pyrinomonadaceae bacterium]